MQLISTLFLAQLGCSSPDTYTQLDEQYSEIRYALGMAERDTTRNIKDNEARNRKLRWANEEVAFFNDASVMSSIEDMRNSPDPLISKKGEAYWRHAILERSWTPAEKEREEELLARIQSKRQEETLWMSRDGATEVALNDSWTRISGSTTALSEDERGDLQDAWVESRMAWLEKDLVELVRLRNEVARREGFATYWELALAHRGLSPEEVTELWTKLEAMIVPINTEFSKERAQIAESNGLANEWATQPQLAELANEAPSGTELDSAYDADLAESRMRTFFSDMGLPMESVQVYPGPSRYTLPGAYGIPIDLPDNIALVISKDRRWSSWHYQALAHEMGLAAWWRLLPEEASVSPVLWDPPTAYFEGIGQFFERMASGAAFAARIEDFDPALAEKLDPTYWRDSISGITHYLATTRTEQMLYERPGQWEEVIREAAALERRLNGQTWNTPTDPSGTPYVRSLQSDLMLHLPGYVQNYLFATATEATLWKVANEAIDDPIGNAKLGEWLRDNLVVPVSTTTTFKEQLSALSGTSDLTAALASYLSERP
ncbi:MAG: hypothetical protein VYB14_06065 [Planctomycetota bacterium]|nr:hypothetical protein [Planctomycetota bacterium]